MTEFTPTPEQLAIVDAAENTKDNLLIRALAGAAKTSTLELLSRTVQVPTLALAFNKRIAVEMADRFPQHCTCQTLNSLGHRAWGARLGRRLHLDKNKIYTILTAAINDLPKKEQDHAYKNFTSIKRAIEYGKSCGFVPTGHFPSANPIIDLNEDFFDLLEERFEEFEYDLILDVTRESIAQGLAGTIDFDDQIFMPTIFPASFPYFPLVLADEAQDFSSLNHRMLQKLCKRSRVIAVGDECQSIYGFRGAHQDSMNLMRETFSMKELGLSISFRCPKKVVLAAQWRAPHMRWPEWAKEGEVIHQDKWSADDLPDYSVVLCRNNAPLFNLGIRLLREGRYPKLPSNDLSKYIIKTLKSFGKADLPRPELIKAIDEWGTAQGEKIKDKKKLADRVDALKVFANAAEDLGGALEYANVLFTAQGPIELMTGHKAKGLEFDTVFILDRDLLRMDEQQDQNLLYVMQTRAKDRLIYIESDTFESKEIHEEDD